MNVLRQNAVEVGEMTVNQKLLWDYKLHWAIYIGSFYFCVFQSKVGCNSGETYTF